MVALAMSPSLHPTHCRVVLEIIRGQASYRPPGANLILTITIPEIIGGIPIEKSAVNRRSPKTSLPFLRAESSEKIARAVASSPH